MSFPHFRNVCFYNYQDQHIVRMEPNQVTGGDNDYIFILPTIQLVYQKQSHFNCLYYYIQKSNQRA